MIGLQDVSVRLGGSYALDRVVLRCARGEFICVVGPNGAGKSTLLKAIAGLVPSTGIISIADRDARTMKARERARAAAYLPQGHVAHWPISVAEAVAIGRLPHGGGPTSLKPADEAAVGRAMAATSVTALAGRPVTELSGGERARVMLARALAVEAPLLLADEPIAALDPAHQLRVMELLARLAADGKTVLAALHDITLAARFAHRVVVLDGGRVAADGPPGRVFDKAILAGVFDIEAAVLQHAGQTVILPWLPQVDLHR